MKMKEFEPDDPMELVGMGVPCGSLEEMAEVLVEEYARLGWNEKRLWALFKNPFFRATHAIYRAKGEEYVSRLIQRTLAKWGLQRAEDLKPEAKTREEALGLSDDEQALAVVDEDVEAPKKV